MYRCDKDSVVPMEYNCSSVAVPVCERAGEVIVSLADDTSCCPRKLCGEAVVTLVKVWPELYAVVMTMSLVTPQCATRACVTSCHPSANSERS